MLKRTLALLLSLLVLTVGGLPVTVSRPTSAHTERKQQTTQEPTVTTLTQSLLERQITGGEEHVYSINLEYDQFLFLDVQQLGINVGIKLIDVDGKLRVETNTPDLVFGAEPFYWVAEKAGHHKIIVYATEPTATRGKYTMKVAQLRAAKDEDFHFLDGQNKLAQGEKFRAQGKKQGFEDSVACYTRAIEHWKEVGQTQREAICLGLISASTYYLGNLQGSIEYIEKAIRIQSDEGSKADLFISAGVIYGDMGNTKKALECYSEALRISQKIGNKAIANILVGLGDSHKTSGNNEEALSYYKQALTLSREAGDRAQEAQALYSMGTIFNALSDYDKAIGFFKEALVMWDKLGNLTDKASALVSVGNSYVIIRDFEKSLQFYQMAIDLSTQIEQITIKGSALNQMGYIYFLKGDYQKGLDYLQEALSIAVNTKGKSNESTILNRLGLIYSALGDQIKALNTYDKAIEIAKALNNPILQRDILYNKTLAYQRSGNLEQAVNEINTTIEMSESSRTTFSSQKLKTSYFATNNVHYKLYVDLLMQLHEKDSSKKYNVQALYISELSKARTLVDLVQEGRLNIREGVSEELINREKDLTQLVNKKTESLIRLLNKPNYSIDDKGALEKQIRELDLELEEVQGKIRKANPHYVGTEKTKVLNLERIQKEVLDKETILLEYSLGIETSYLWLVTDKSISSYKLPSRQEVEKAANNALIYYKTFFRPENESVEDKKENDAKEQFLIKNANEFSQMLLGSVANQLANKRILVVPDGILQYIPFAALPDPSKTIKEYHPLIVEHEVVTMPSASTMGVLRSQFSERKPAPKSIMVLADPILTATDERLAVNNNKKRETLSKNLDKKTQQKSELSLAKRAFEGVDLVRLVAASDEAQNIGQIYKDATIALGSKASLPTATSSEVSDYRILHFATHGFFNSFQPELSGVVLSLFDDNGNEQEGYLSANHIYNLRLSADLVVLSACQTGLGKDIRGEGILGITRGFMYAGAERVMFTIWSVNDKSTSVLMTKFYTALKEGSTPSLALRQAQISMWKDKKWSAPYYWAAFQIQGEWKTKK